VWLCAEPPGSTAVLAPLWARRVIGELTERNERVIVRALSGYPGLAADAAALLRVAVGTGRLPVALLPTPFLAARTRTLLRASAADPVDLAGADPGTAAVSRAASGAIAASGPAAATAGFPAIQGCPATDAPTVTAALAAAGGSVAETGPAVTGECTGEGRVAVTEGFVADGLAAVTSEFAVTGHCAGIGEKPATPQGAANFGPGPRDASTRSADASVTPVVGVGRRRAGTEHGPAAAVTVLAGPVAAGARLPRRTMPSARLLGQWARVLEPSGVLAVLSPPPVGRHRAPGGRWEGSPVPELAVAGLSWTDHIVLVHAPTTGDGLPHPDGPRRRELPFAPVHTCLDLFESELDNPAINPAGVEVSR
jgi:hypothetical protein